MADVFNGIKRLLICLDQIRLAKAAHFDGKNGSCERDIQARDKERAIDGRISRGADDVVSNMRRLLADIRALLYRLTQLDTLL